MINYTLSNSRIRMLTAQHDNPFSSSKSRTIRSPVAPGSSSADAYSTPVDYVASISEWFASRRKGATDVLELISRVLSDEDYTPNEVDLNRSVVYVQEESTGISPARIFSIRDIVSTIKRFDQEGENGDDIYISNIEREYDMFYLTYDMISNLSVVMDPNLVRGISTLEVIHSILLASAEEKDSVLNEYISLGFYDRDFIVCDHPDAPENEFMINIMDLVSLAYDVSFRVPTSIQYVVSEKEDRFLLEDIITYLASSSNSFAHLNILCDLVKLQEEDPSSDFISRYLSRSEIEFGTIDDKVYKIGNALRDIVTATALSVDQKINTIFNYFGLQSGFSGPDYIMTTPNLSDIGGASVWSAFAASIPEAFNKLNDISRKVGEAVTNALLGLLNTSVDTVKRGVNSFISKVTGSWDAFKANDDDHVSNIFSDYYSSSYLGLRYYDPGMVGENIIPLSQLTIDELRDGKLRTFSTPWCQYTIKKVFDSDLGEAIQFDWLWKPTHSSSYVEIDNINNPVLQKILPIDYDHQITLRGIFVAAMEKFTHSNDHSKFNIPNVEVIKLLDSSINMSPFRNNLYDPELDKSGHEQFDNVLTPDGCMYNAILTSQLMFTLYWALRLSQMRGSVTVSSADIMNAYNFIFLYRGNSNNNSNLDALPNWKINCNNRELASLLLGWAFDQKPNSQSYKNLFSKGQIGMNPIIHQVECAYNSSYHSYGLWFPFNTAWTHPNGKWNVLTDTELSNFVENILTTAIVSIAVIATSVAVMKMLKLQHKLKLAADRTSWQAVSACGKWGYVLDDTMLQQSWRLSRRANLLEAITSGLVGSVKTLVSAVPRAITTPVSMAVSAVKDTLSTGVSGESADTLEHTTLRDIKTLISG